MHIGSKLHSIKRYSRIGIFDSGVGGLSVLRQLQKLNTFFEEYDLRFVYLGDTARCPYGNRFPEEISMFVEQITNWLQAQNVDAIVIACNTSAAIAYDRVKNIVQAPLFDLIRPTAAYVAQMRQVVGVMSTVATARSKAFSQAIHVIDPSVEVIEIGCPELVPIIENNAINESSTYAILNAYAQQIKRNGVKALILGCTHFPFIAPILRDLLPQDVIVVDPAKILLDSFISNGNGNGYEKDVYTECNGDSVTFFVTGSAAQFADNTKALLGFLPETVYNISFDELTSCAVKLKEYV